MFKFENLNSIHLEITSQCQASCPMCSRNFHGGLPNPLLIGKSWTFQNFKKIFDDELINQIKDVIFCGNFGDPVINKELAIMCLYLKNKKSELKVTIHTNGSLRTRNWWKNLYDCLPQNHRVVFALDGLADTHHLYRIGTNYKKIIDNAKTFIECGGIAEWCFIKFKHNEHQVEEARKLAQKFGFKYFTVKNSSRFIGEPKFEVLNKIGEITHVIEPPLDNKINFIGKTIIENYKNVIMPLEIDCMAKHAGEVYIDHNMNVFPCCFIAFTPFTNYDASKFGSEIKFKMYDQYNDLIMSLGGIEQLSAIKQGVKKIINSTAYQTVWETFWTTKKMVICARICGKSSQISQPKDQFLEKDKLG